MRGEAGASDHAPVWIALKDGASKGSKRPGKKAAAAKSRPAVPDFIAPQLCESVAQPPSQKGWVHEVKLDGYRTQIQVRNGRAILRTRKGLDWTARFKTTAKAVAALPDCIVDGEVVALDSNGVPRFPALQAALSEGRSQDLVYFAFDLLFEGNERSARRAVARAKGAPEEAPQGQ